MVHHMSTLLSFPIWEHLLERYCFLVCRSCKHFNFTQLFPISFFFLRKLVTYRDYFNYHGAVRKQDHYIRLAQWCTEMPERCGPFCLWKLRQMGTHGADMKGVPSWLFCWAGHAGTRDFCSAWATLVSLVQNIFPQHTLFHFICPHCQQAG
jgi:hypothetical protein